MSIESVSLADDVFKSSFLEGKLSIDCVEIKLTQKGSPDPRVYSSAGFIRVDPEFGAEARLVFKRDPSNPYDPFASLMEMSSMRSGELYSESHYYRLEATDVVGNVWINPAVMPKFEARASAEILTFTCDHIETQISTDTKADFVHFVFPEDLKFPLNKSTNQTELVRGQERLSIKRTHSSGTVSGIQVQYHKCLIDTAGDSFELVALAKDNGQVPERFDERLLEAIRFCSATRALPVMSEVSQAGQRIVRLAKAAPLNNGLIPPPLSDLGASQDFYRLMGCYFDYACQNAKGNGGAQLSTKLEGLFTLKGVWLETIALLLCVATEGILDDPLFKPLGKPNATLMGLIKELFDWVKKAPVEQGLQNRALSSMGSMKSNRAVDKMYALVTAGALDEADVASWKFLRNPSAHGGLEIDEDKFQELLDQVYCLVTFIYKLTFLKIGYVGKFSDYSRRGWPSRDYDAPTLLKALGGETPTESTPEANFEVSASQPL
ncbi:hypothetical protein LPB67_14045 [Undibacterium sp. Jales W-56]|uniref:hypothetical protein n=1 Tax=Undibacterium sp. Jales W-56 TaxID=2897325 RepID=UPI0021CEC5BF|nr:hypothetical protein [Undibacterium sp. Jales W-56]MCU6434894.1 hypothetical protein [Undibacterium sp. Jales W-56]